MLKVAIDNGHGINTAGKRTPKFEDGTQIREWQFNFPTAVKLKEELDRCGFETLMVSPTNQDTPLATRVKRSNDFKADVFVSIHFNAYKGVWGTHGGVDTHYYKGTKKGGEVLASCIQYELVKATGLRDRGIVPNNFYVTRKTVAPAVLVECGFMDNKDEAKLMLDENYQLKCAVAIAKGICKFLGVDYISAEDKNDELYFVQIGAYKLQQNAYVQLEKAQRAGFKDAFIKRGKP